MGSLGAGDGVGLFFGWMWRPQISKHVGQRTEILEGWTALAASSRYEVGLFASGAQLQLLSFLSSNRGLNNRRKRPVRSGRHCCDILECHGSSRKYPPFARVAGRNGPSSRWSLAVLLSKPWGSWYEGQSGPSKSSKIGVTAAVLGRGNDGNPSEPSEKKDPSRILTNLILAVNLLVFFGQIASKGRLLLWGAKVNSLIDKGQFWRLLTPCVLHANVFHLLVNSYSLNAIGPTVESLAGPKRFMAVYTTSALASTTLSYFCCSAPSVGASGAIFGLVGALAVFLVRHKNMMVGGEQSLQQVTRVIAINMVLGLVSGGIDNWGHFGGLVGGTVVTWLLGPVYSFESPPGGGQKQLVDRPPISYLIPSKVTRH